jgi:hypothetical protein
MVYTVKEPKQSMFNFDGKPKVEAEGDGPKDPSRRKFLNDVVAGGVAAAALATPTGKDK